MVANRIEPARNTLEQRIVPIVLHNLYLAMRGFHTPHHPTEFERNPLVPETDAQHRNNRMADHIRRNPKIARGCGMPRPRRDHNRVETPRLDHRPIGFVIANDGGQIPGQDRGGMGEIPGERVVVIDDQEPQHDFAEAVRRVLPGPR